MRALLILFASMVTSSASAELRDLCVDRPGLGTPACTIDTGHAIVEIGLVDWTLDRQPDARADMILSGNVLVRVGLDEMTEAQIGWTAYGHVRTRDVATELVSRNSSAGDLLLSVRRSVSGPNGPAAIQGFLTLPVGSDAIGAGDWGVGILVPFGFDFGHNIMLDLTPEIDAAVDQDRSGRHLALGSSVGISAPLSKELTGTVELSVFRDNDPDVHSTTSLASVSFGYQTDTDTQIDFGAVAGLNNTSPDVELYLGISRRF